MKNFMILFLITASLPAWACKCAMSPEFSRQEDLAEYAFIARIKITHVDSVKWTHGDRTRDIRHDIQFETLELFKGAAMRNLTVEGSHPSFPEVSVDCDLGENVGEEWLVFAVVHPTTHQIMLRFCSGSSNLRPADEYRVKLVASRVERLRGIFR